MPHTFETIQDSIDVRPHSKLPTSDMKWAWVFIIGASSVVYGFDFLPSPTPPDSSKHVGVFYQGDQLFKSGKTHREQLAISVPISVTPRDYLEPGFRGTFLNLPPRQGRPQRLWKSQPYLLYSHYPKEGTVWRTILEVGSSSDHPYASFKETAIQLTAFYAFQQSERHRWTFYMNYSSLRPPLSHIPLPGLAYTYLIPKRLKLDIGAPFLSIEGQFLSQRVKLSAMGFFPFFTRVEASVRIIGPIFLYTSWKNATDIYYRFARPKAERSLYVREQSASFGLRAPVAPMIFADLQAGYRFKRSLYEAHRFSNKENAPVEHLPAGPFFAWTLMARF